MNLCGTCEEPIDVLDLCEPCHRLEHGITREKPVPIPREPKRVRGSRLCSPEVDPSPCVRGHAMVWRTVRWRCNQCEALYAERKREKAKMRNKRTYS